MITVPVKLSDEVAAGADADADGASVEAETGGDAQCGNKRG